DRRNGEAVTVRRVHHGASKQAAAGGEVLDQVLNPDQGCLQRRVGRRGRCCLGAHAVVSGSGTFFISTQHRARCMGSTSSSGGSSVKHRSIRNLHRVWNFHPGGILPRSGGKPLIEMSLSLAVSSMRGIERSNDHV